MSVPPPTKVSLRHRASIVKLISPLRRVRARVPFWELAAHRIPTLWSLYRGLLRHTERENIRHHVKAFFRENQHTTSARAARNQLRQAHSWLDVLCRAKAGDTRLQAVLDRYDRLLAVRRDKLAWKSCIHRVFNEEAAARLRPRVKGSFIRQTLYNKLLPRLVPQPAHVGGMIRRRRDARQRRIETQDELRSWLEDLSLEARFEANLLRTGQRSETPSVQKKEFSGVLYDKWAQPIRAKLDVIRDTFTRDMSRLTAPYPRALLLAARRARQRIVANATRVKECEAQGLYHPATLARMRRGPPPHALAKMSPEQRRLDRVVRGPAEGGYAGAVKQRLGMKLRSSDLWKREGGQEENQAMLDALEDKIRTENERRESSASGTHS